MEKQKVFPGVTFTPYRPSDIVIITIPLDEDSTKNVPTEHRLTPKPMSQDFREFVASNNVTEREPVATDELFQTFTDQLEKLSESLGQPLPLDNIDIQFVSKKDLQTRTPEDIEALRKRYGDYIIDGAVGECITNTDGTYTIKVSKSLLEKDPGGRTTLEVIAHEYGHTLGERFTDAIDEELKAHAFANLFMMHYLDVQYYSNFGFSTDTVHTESLYRLDILTSQIGSPDMLLAHLTGNTFGKYEPDDYLQHI